MSDLPGLKALELAGNEIESLEALAGLTSLEVLYLSENQIPHAGPLSELTGLRVLDLSGNHVADVTPLAGPIAPTGLVLDDNAVSDLSSLTQNGGLADRPSHLSLSRNPLSQESLCTTIPELAEAGVIVRGAGRCASESESEEELPAIINDRTLYISERQDIRASFINRGTDVLHGNKCSDGTEWEFQLRVERLVEDEWTVAFDPAALLCLGPQEIEPGEEINFEAFGVGAPTGVYRLVWSQVFTDVAKEDAPPTEERASAEFSIVAP